MTTNTREWLRAAGLTALIFATIAAVVLVGLANAGLVR